MACKCGCGETIEIPRPDTPHQAEVRCANPKCNTHIMWKKKDKNNGKRPKNKFTPADLGINYCEMCQRPKARLGNNETLISHHKVEVGPQQRGVDVPGNIWVVCSHCHALIHHVRIYMNNHWGDMWEQYEKMKFAIEQKDISPEEYESEIIESLEKLENPPWDAV